MRLDAASTALLFLSAASAVIVPPPTNVSVFCTNLHVTVRWTYSDKQPQTRFHVRIQGSDGAGSENETTEHEYDLTHYIWQSDLHYMGFMYVTVTAVQGGERSLSVNTPSFTFNGLKKAHVTCALDFPPVNVAAEEAATAVTFHNPFHFYTELRNSKRNGDAFIEFTVVSDQGALAHTVCRSTQIVCRYDLSVSDDVEKCVTLRGRLDYGNNVEYVLFKETERICAHTPGSHIVVTTVLLVVLVLVVLIVSISIYAVKAWSLKPFPKPTLPVPVLTNPDRGRHFFPVTGEEFHRVTVLIHGSRSPSLCSEGGDCQGGGSGDAGGGGGSGDTGGGGSADAGGGVYLQPPPFASLYTDGRLLEDSSQDLEAVGLMSTGHGTDDDSVKTECFCMEEEEGEEPNAEPLPEDNRSHYDRPHIL
ncbi:interferon gamma receptor 1 precursor [Solea senegalensis]|uniref:Interferon gamma receptor 1 n=1 Tax=Solea senegalensis TaxID=28829 RepID=A0AAV6PHS8_SOLSE|nr:interferon gamma receptor 1 precursor [Solea senegalensis]